MRLFLALLETKKRSLASLIFSHVVSVIPEHAKATHRLALGASCVMIFDR